MRSRDAAEVHALLSCLPKSELHVHLEGVVTGSFFDSLAMEKGVQRASEATKPAGSLDGFIEQWRSRTHLLSSLDDYRRLASAAARELAGAGVVHSEVHFSPGSAWRRFGLDPCDVARAVRQGMDEASPRPRSLRLIADLVRDHGPDHAAEMVRRLATVAQEADVVAVGLGGSEAAFGPAEFSDAFRRAADAGFARVAHAGEEGPPRNVTIAIDALGARRIGHGVRAALDPEVEDYLLGTGVAIEVCLTSNLQTGAVARLAEHPVRRWVERGARIVLSSDDPGMMGTSIEREYELLVAEAGLALDEAIQIMRAGFECAFLDDATRATYLHDFDLAVRDVLPDRWHGPAAAPGRDPDIHSPAVSESRGITRGG